MLQRDDVNFPPSQVMKLGHHSMNNSYFTRGWITPPAPSSMTNSLYTQL